MTNLPNFKIDALLPHEMAVKAEEVGVKKVQLSNLQTLLLAVLAGAFIALAAQFYTITMVGTKEVLGFGLSRLAGGLVFCLGLVLVVIGGAELFTGNNLKVMAFASGKVTFKQVLRNWTIVYIGNFLGSILIVVGIYFTGQYAFADNSVGQLAINIAEGKCALDFTTALFRGIFCNILVCLAIWLCFSARSNTDKVLCIIFPITAFVACGFEHSIANMYFIPIGWVLKQDTAFLAAIGKTASDFPHLTMSGFLYNLTTVTIGNIIGGAVLVGTVYWMIFRFKQNTK